jgi:hypothetical protein
MKLVGDGQRDHACRFYSNSEMNRDYLSSVPFVKGKTHGSFSNATLKKVVIRRVIAKKVSGSNCQL